MSVLVIGGTGLVGSLVCETLTIAGADVSAASRGGAAPTGGRAVRFDWYDPATWDGALDSVDRMYLIAPTGDVEPLAAMQPFLDHALISGVKRAVLQSGSPIPKGGPGLGRVHAAIAETFPEWAVLRPSWFMQNFSGRHVQGDAIRAHGRIVSATGRGRVAFIDVRDIAAVAAVALTADVASNRDPILTGPAALSYDDVAAILTRTLGRSITHDDVGPDGLRRVWEADGLPPDYAAMLVAGDVAIAGGAEDRLTDEVQRITGRPPRSFEQFAAEARWDGMTEHADACATDRLFNDGCDDL